MEGYSKLGKEDYMSVDCVRREVGRVQRAVRGGGLKGVYELENIET